MGKLRFAQAGVAALHAGMYRDTLLLMQDEVELVGFYDPEPDAVRSSIKPNAAQVPFYDSIAELLEQARPDALLVSTFNRDEPAWMLEAARAGVHVWVEKPCAAHSTQLFPVADELERRRLQFSCGYSWRYHPVSRLIKQTVDAGLLGKLYAIEFRFATSSVKRRGADNWGFQREITGGGILNWLGCHWFDLMRFLTGAEVSRVAAIEANVGGQAIDVEDAASVALQFDNGMIGSLNTGFFTPGESAGAMTMHGSLGYLSWDLEHACTIYSAHVDWQTAPRRHFDLPPAPIGGYGPEGLALMQAFAGAIRGDGSSGYTIDDAIKALQIIEAAHRSSDTGTSVAPAARAAQGEAL